MSRISLSTGSSSVFISFLPPSSIAKSKGVFILFTKFRISGTNSDSSFSISSSFPSLYPLAIRQSKEKTPVDRILFTLVSLTRTRLSSGFVPPRMYIILRLCRFFTAESSFSMTSPMQEGSAPAKLTTDVCSRWETEKASFTYRSNKGESASTIMLPLEGLNSSSRDLTFLRRITSPLFISVMLFFASSHIKSFTYLTST